MYWVIIQYIPLDNNFGKTCDFNFNLYLGLFNKYSIGELFLSSIGRLLKYF
jgi:hypothetical protein